MNKGDYVLATKYHDGCPRDHFVVGFYDGRLKDRNGKETDRHMVIDADGRQFRANGFRRCEKISAEIGALIVDAIPLLEMGHASIWYWRYHPAHIKRLLTL